MTSFHKTKGDFHKHIAAIHEEYGPTVRIAPDELSFTSPGAWPQIYSSRPQLQRSNFQSGLLKLPKSMIETPDAEHMRLRRLAAPAFLNSGVKEMETVLQRYIDTLCSQLAKRSGAPLNLVDWFRLALSDVIGQLALGQEFRCLELGRMHPWPRLLLKGTKQSAAFIESVLTRSSRGLLCKFQSSSFPSSPLLTDLAFGGPGFDVSASLLKSSNDLRQGA